VPIVLAAVNSPREGLEVIVSKSKLLIVAFLAASQSAVAQTPPNAGSQTQQIPPPPLVQRSIPEIRIERPGTQSVPEAAGPALRVTSLRITGATQFSEAELIEAAEFKPGSELDLSELRTMASKISEYYNSRGYFVAQAYLPAQAINNGAVTIAVVEGRYGEITLRNQTNLSDDLAGNVLDGLSGEIVAARPLERRLLLLSDVPGVDVQSTLTPGASVGTSDLIVDVNPGRRVTGVIEADNAGNRYTGAYRGGATVNFNNPTGLGDVLTLRGLSSFSGLSYVRASYQAQVYSATIGVAYSALWYELGREFSALKADGTARIASVYGSYPLIRSYDNNLYAVLAFDAKTFEDRTGVPFSDTDKSARVVVAGLHGDHHDNVGGGGWTYYSISAAFGELDIETPAALAVDAASARSNGNYNKFAFEAARLQTLTGPVSLYARVRGQVASKNLDVSEKMELGGAYAVRAYPEGEAYGDEGYVASLEARLMLPGWSERLPGHMQLFAFVDTGHITVNDSPWVSGSNSRTLSATGLGVTWTDDNDFMLRVTYAHKLGSAVATSAPDSSGRVWVQLSKVF
jgi:hemolysin activation/secretion protein